MAITTRAGKGSKLTIEEMDTNFIELEQKGIGNAEAIEGKVDEEPGKGLSEVNFTSAKDSKLNSIASGATVNSPDSYLLNTQNHVGPYAADRVSQNSTYRFVSDTEKNTWNSKQDALGYIPLNSNEKAAPNGIATLGSDGKIPSGQIPLIALTKPNVVNSEAEMLALVAQEGDFAVRTDVSKTFVLGAGNPTIASSWIELVTPSGSVSSVNGQAGPTVTLTTDNIGEGTKKYSTAALVLGYFLTGLTPGTGHIAIAATDNILSGFNKIAGSIADLYSLVSGKATPEDIEQALDASEIYFSSEGFEGENFPDWQEGDDPSLKPGTQGNPLFPKSGTVIEVATVVEDGNLNPVTSDAVFESQATQTLLITGGSSYTIADLYELFTNGGLAPEIAPTAFVVDDEANTAGFTLADPGDALSDYEYKILDDIITTVTTNPILVGNINAGIGTVKIRKKGETGVSSPSPWLVNPTAYTAASGDGNYMPGYVPIDLLSFTLASGAEFLSEDNGVYTQGAEGNYKVTTKYHMPNGARIAYKVLSVATDLDTNMGTVDAYDLSNIRGMEQFENTLYRKYFSDDLIPGVTVAVGDHLIVEFLDPNNGTIDDGSVRQFKFYKTSDGGATITEIPLDPIFNYVSGNNGYVGFLIARNSVIGYPQQIGLILDTEV